MDTGMHDVSDCFQLIGCLVDGAVMHHGQFIDHPDTKYLYRQLPLSINKERDIPSIKEFQYAPTPSPAGTPI